MSTIDQTPAPAPPAAPAAPALPALPALPTPAGQTGAPASLEALRTQLADLNVQYAALRAQWNGLRSQLNEMLQTNPARPGVQNKWADVGVQMAQVRGDIARVEAKISQIQGQAIPGVPTPPPFTRRSGPDPDMMVGLSFALLLAVVLPTSIAYARRVWRGGNRPAPRPASEEIGVQRFERLEQAVDAIAIEVERVSEGQRFVTKVLTERPPQAAANAAAPHAVANAAPVEARPEAQQQRALGAGPLEPIRMPERQAVKQSITPR